MKVAALVSLHFDEAAELTSETSSNDIHCNADGKQKVARNNIGAGQSFDRCRSTEDE